MLQIRPFLLRLVHLHMTSDFRARELVRLLRRHEKEMVATLRAFVECESPSADKAAVDRFGEMVAREWRRRDATVRVIRQREAGNHVRAEIVPAARGKVGQLLILGHLDTVYPLGTLRTMPFRAAGGRAFGPGTFDMKGGLVLALFAVDALREAGLKPAKRLVFFWDSDEEIGSHSSRKLIEAEARRSDAVLVLEPSLGLRGDLKTQRKGVGTAEIIVRGRAAHAGIDPAAGVNAVHELALQIERLMKMNDPANGITVQATVLAGGSASNVVPAEARAQVDVRCARLADVMKVNRRLQSMRPILKNAKIEVRGGINRPPLERTAAVRKLFAHAQKIAREMGIDLREGSTGGGSDGNFTAALGVPTLDGLGVVGDGAHALNEHLVIGKMAERAALIAALFATL
ncbi:MAG TPA: M20 family metallopeptidase [Candidatus Binatia bacterium]|nr:M20 family metallopeptidase [Candidatus Binatia bacterium]